MALHSDKWKQFLLMLLSEYRPIDWRQHRRQNSYAGIFDVAEGWGLTTTDVANHFLAAPFPPNDPAMFTGVSTWHSPRFSDSGMRVIPCAESHKELKHSESGEERYGD